MDEVRKQQLVEKLAHQTAALVTKAGLAPDEVAELYLDTALALAIQSGVPPIECAVTLRTMATRLEAVDHESGGSPGGADLEEARWVKGLALKVGVEEAARRLGGALVGLLVGTAGRAAAIEFLEALTAQLREDHPENWSTKW